MTAIQMNAELFRELSIIAEDELLMAKMLKYAKKLTAKKADSTLMTRKEFFDRIDKAKAGRTYSMLPDENLTEFLKRQGYDL